MAAATHKVQFYVVVLFRLFFFLFFFVFSIFSLLLLPLFSFLSHCSLISLFYSVIIYTYILFYSSLCPSSRTVFSCSFISLWKMKLGEENTFFSFFSFFSVYSYFCITWCFFKKYNIIIFLVLRVCMCVHCDIYKLLFSVYVDMDLVRYVFCIV